MDQYTTWDDPNLLPVKTVPLHSNEEFEQYFEYNEVDDLFNETLTGLQDLDVPSGFVQSSQLLLSNPQFNNATTSPDSKKHSRQQSGTAIFGFNDHTRELSINGITSDLYKSVKPSVDLSKSVIPGELLKSLANNNNLNFTHTAANNINPTNDNLELNFLASMKPMLIPEESEFVAHKQSKSGSQLSSPPKTKSANDYIVTNQNPTSYKFPPPQPSPNHINKQTNSYSVKYLKELHKYNNFNSSPIRHSQKQDPQTYVDDIEPLLDNQIFSEPIQPNYSDVLQSQSTPHKATGNSKLGEACKFVPIPVQQPTYQKKQEYQEVNLKNSTLFLPPPSPPSLSHGSPEWSSPEPQSPSPAKLTINQGYYANANSGGRPPINNFVSPVQQHNLNNNRLYEPQFFSDNVYSEESIGYPSQSSSVPPSLNSSPVKYQQSPLRNTQLTNDDTVDANDTITQLTPLKNQFPSTPSKNKIKLEWSPIISPNAKSARDVRAAIQQSSPRRKIKKTSLLPPGELDQYWEGPDENKIFTCTYRNCGKKFTRRYNVRSHIQTHLSDRPFGCSYCPKKFVRQHDLNRHVKGHLEARHCQCPCGKEFARLDAMRKHRARNICSGGIANTENNCISKPSKLKNNGVLMNQDVLDELNANADFNPSFGDEFLEDLDE